MGTPFSSFITVVLAFHKTVEQGCGTKPIFLRQHLVLHTEHRTNIGNGDVGDFHHFLRRNSKNPCRGIARLRKTRNKRCSNLSLFILVGSFRCSYFLMEVRPKAWYTLYRKTDHPQKWAIGYVEILSLLF